MTSAAILAQATPMSDLAPFALGIAIAGVAGLLSSGLAAILGRKGEAASGSRWGTAIGIGVGYMLGHATIRGWLMGPSLRETRLALATWYAEGGPNPLVPAVAEDWLPWLVGVTLLIAVLDGGRPSPGWARWENRLLLSCLALWLILRPLVEGTWEPGQGARWLIGLGLGMLAFWGVIDTRADRLGPSMPLVLMTMAIAAAVCLQLSQSSILCLFATTLAATLGGVWLVSWFHPRMSLARGAVPVFVVPFVGLLLCGLFYSELPRISALALMLAPLATYVDRIGPVTRLAGWKVAAIRGGAILIPLAVAIGVAYAMQPVDPVYPGP